MEANVCKHFQRGYCRYGKGCRKQHIEEICNTPKCSNKSCTKRHPKDCKYFFLKKVCKFGDKCLYKHNISSDKSEIDILIQEVKSLKATIVILVDKVSDLEKGIFTVKSESRKMSLNESSVEGEPEEITNSKESEAGISEDSKKVKVSLSVKKMKVKLKKAITKKNTSGKKIMDCDFCDYSCKKQLTLKKHMTNNHKDNDEIFSLSEIKKPIPANDKSKKSFVFSESMLDKFDPWLN